MDWLPIESAPKDGSFILLFSSGDGVNMARWGVPEPFGDEKAWTTPSEGPGYSSEIENPTHWMPLPNPPSGGRK